MMQSNAHIMQNAQRAGQIMTAGCGALDVRREGIRTMLDNTQIKARELVIESIDKVIEKYSKKAEKEKLKANKANVTYEGETYYSDAELQDAYSCDAFTSATYDRLIDKLNKARGNVDSWAMTPSESLVCELNFIRNNFTAELIQSKNEAKIKAEHESRAQELANEGYSYNEIQAIIGNEELMRFE